jgi:hypothetical protein
MRNIFLFLFLTLGFTSIAFAGDGKYTLSYEISDNSWDSGVDTVVGATLDEDDNGYAFILDYDLGNNLVIEAAYRDFGEASLSGSSGNTFNYNGTSYTFNATAAITLEADTLSFGLKKSLSLTDNISAFARLGFHRYETTIGLAVGTASASTSVKDEDIYYGAGLSYAMGNMKLNLSHNNYDLDWDEVDSTAISLSYNLAF